MSETRYRVEQWVDSEWQRVTSEYLTEEWTTGKLNGLTSCNPDSAFRLVKCTFEVLSLSGFLIGQKAGRKSHDDE